MFIGIIENPMAIFLDPFVREPMTSELPKGKKEEKEEEGRMRKLVDIER